MTNKTGTFLDNRPKRTSRESLALPTPPLPLTAGALLSKPLVHRLFCNIQSPDGRDCRLNLGPKAPKFYFFCSSASLFLMAAYSAAVIPDGTYGLEFSAPQVVALRLLFFVPSLFAPLSSFRAESHVSSRDVTLLRTG